MRELELPDVQDVMLEYRKIQIIISFCIKRDRNEIRDIK
mgnify:CR=1 FL=1